MKNIDWQRVASITTTGSAGSATGTSGTVSLTRGGVLYAIFIDFTTMPATTDVTINEVLPNAGTRNLLTTTNVNTDGVYMVQLANSTVAGAAGTGFVYPVIGSQISVSVAQGDAITGGVVVYMMVGEA